MNKHMAESDLQKNRAAKSVPLFFWGVITYLKHF